ncbi:twin-arginine translocase TatA/TatE family subunit [Sandarakinorhabdus sp.]|uniref:twin-arginine translocase TatA/TatE family subunit n=1 Tax=Sandarakinorhabdus sp. TaxID=1916663 RepID=UPI00286E2672|nr:twin-arginine translocase TatA/TatE family subunit [Sandarakinorhabdus sp.]
MGSFSLIHWVVLILVVMLLFGRGRISDLMGDFAKGINSFKKGLADGETPPAPAPPQVTNAAAPVATPVTEDQRTQG